MLRYKIKIYTIIIFLSLTNIAQANINKHISNPQKIGSSKFKVLFWDVYDATLLSEDGKFSYDKIFALRLDYKRELYGEKIAERSAEEMRKIGFKDEVRLAAWFTQMKNIFPDVKDGNHITGIYDPNGSTYFYKDGKQIGIVNDKEFGKWFFGIWLSEKTSEPKLRKKLLGIR